MYIQNTIEHFRRMETQWNLEKASLEHAEASVRAQVCACVCMHVFIHIYIYMYTYTYMYMHRVDSEEF